MNRFYFTLFLYKKIHRKDKLSRSGIKWPPLFSGDRDEYDAGVAGPHSVFQIHLIT
jgi:hypothetical protein